MPDAPPSGKDSIAKSVAMANQIPLLTNTMLLHCAIGVQDLGVTKTCSS